MREIRESLPTIPDQVLVATVLEVVTLLAALPGARCYADSFSA